VGEAMALTRQIIALCSTRFNANLFLAVLCVKHIKVQSPYLISGTTEWVFFYYLKKPVVGLERGSLSLVSTTEKLLDRKVAAPV
jgi:hypothetical protein